jgi:hypothetical protein
MSGIIDVLLLLALPASGKSEVRRYLSHLDPRECAADFHLGPTVQLDDFPYVHLMRRIAKELTLRDQDGIFFNSEVLPFKEPRDWGTLVELINEDFRDLTHGRRPASASAAAWLFERLDAARAKVGAVPALARLDDGLRREVSEVLEAEAADLLAKKIAEIPDTLAGKTIVIEFARGGADGSSMPLPAPYGYRYSLSRLSPEILARASILYIWVSPDESRRKNHARTDPNDPGSILHHGVPLAVMYGDYGCDDIAWLLETSERPGSVRVEAGGRLFHVPLAKFDNRVDKTTFIRAEPSEWPPDQIAALRAELQRAFAHLAGRD